METWCGMNAGGFGANFSKLRSKHAYVSTIKGKSSGAVSFMKPFSDTTELISLHSSTKRGANMFLLSAKHPEIFDYVNAKIDFDKGYSKLKYANLSVDIDDAFVDSVIHDKKWVLTDPYDYNITEETEGRKLWSNIIMNATLHAEPGIINFDSINKDYPLRFKEKITSVNPCSEFTSRDKSVCVLGSLNLYAFLYKTGEGNIELDMNVLYQYTQLLHTFLTLSNFANEFPLETLTHNTREMRNTGLGYMGLSSVLTMLGYRYGSKEAKEFFEKIMHNITLATITNSHMLGELIGGYVGYNELIEKFKSGELEDGPIYTGKQLNVKFNTTEFIVDNIYYLLNHQNPKTAYAIGYNHEIYAKIANMRMMAIAPTGSISFLTQVSSGVEPIFFFAYNRRINPDMPSEYTVSVYDTALKDYLMHRKGKTEEEAKEIIANMANTGVFPEELKEDYLVTTSDLDIADRIAMLVVSSTYIDMNTSVTFNIQRDTKIDDALIGKLHSLNDPIIEEALAIFEEHRFDVKEYVNKFIKENKQHYKAVVNFVSSGIYDSEEKDKWLDKYYDTYEPERLVKEDKYKDFIKVVQTTNDFYLLSQLLEIKGVTVYVEGSRTPILTRKTIKPEEKKGKKKQLLKLDLNIDKKTKKVLPKERPAILETLKKTVLFKINNQEKKMFIELGMVEGDPFEIFFRPSESTKEYAELFETAGRLISVSIRSGVKLEEAINQLKKVKNWRNDYSPVTQVMYESLNELLAIAKSKGKKRKELIQKEEETKNWIMSPKGYYIDENGKKRCPVCKSEVTARDGCIDCNQCGWTACS